MTHLFYEPLPEHIRADGVKIPILTDFRAWLQFIGLVNDKGIAVQDKVTAMAGWLLEDRPVTAAVVEALTDFCRAKELDPDEKEKPEQKDPPGGSRRPPCFDWVVDAKYVLGDFRRFYGIDLLNAALYLHWWEFRALFAALPEEAVTMRRMSLRATDLSKIKDKSQRSRIAAAQRAIALPFEMDEDMIGDVFAQAFS